MAVRLGSMFLYRLHTRISVSGFDCSNVFNYRQFDLRARLVATRLLTVLCSLWFACCACGACCACCACLLCLQSLVSWLCLLSLLSLLVRGWGLLCVLACRDLLDLLCCACNACCACLTPKNDFHSMTLQFLSPCLSLSVYIRWPHVGHQAAQGIACHNH